MIDHKPLWVEIRDELERDLKQGHYRPGDKLPTEAELSGRFGVNRHTVRRALAALNQEGLVLSRRGAGVFVTTAPTRYRISKRTRFHQNLVAAGQNPEKTVLRLETRAASRIEAEELGLQQGANVHVWEGISLADNLPIAHFLSVFCAARFPELLDALRKTQSVTQALMRCGLRDYTRASTKITAQNADAVQARHLQIQTGTALVATEALNVDADGKPVEFGRTWFVGERVELILET